MHGLTFRRILLNAQANADNGGGSSQSQGETQGQETRKTESESESESKTKETEPPSSPPLPPGARVLTSEQWQEIESARQKLADFEKAESEKLRQAQEKETQALIAKGQAEDAVKKVREDLTKELDTERQNRQTIEQRARNYARDNALTLALANHQLVPGAAAQLAALLKADLEAVPEGESFAVRTKDQKPAAQYVAERLALPEFKHFLQPSTQGGTAVPGQHNGRPPAEPPQSPPVKNLGEALLSRAIAHKAAGEQKATEGLTPVTFTFPTL